MNSLLTEESIIKVLNKLTHSKKDMSYTIEKSVTTFSFYITIYYNDVKRSARISDHISSKKLLNTLVIGKNTKRKTVESFLTNVVKKLIQTYELKENKLGENK